MRRQTWLQRRGHEAATPPANGEIAIVNYDRCSYCGACVPVCPPNCITLHDATLQIVEELCTGCGRCMLVCPTAALTMQAGVVV
jgi:MinD superfamily P-loop ATPase